MSLRQRVTGFHFPAWSPVAFIIVLVLVILGVIVYLRGATGDPRIGDHNHAAYVVIICGEKQPPIRVFEDSQGIHTHGDGIIHMHPFNTAGEGPGAAVRRFFEYGAGQLTQDLVKVPGSKDTFKAGQNDCNGQPAEVRVLRADSGIHPLGGGQVGSSFSDAISECNAMPESKYQVVGERYIPKDGDCIRIIFGPPKVEPVIQPDRTVIDQSQATRTIEMEVTGDPAAPAFSPASIDVSAGETVKVVLKNNVATGFHGLRFAGPDATYGNSDDFVTESPTLDPGQSSFTIIRYDNTGQYEFRDEAASDTPITGKVVVAAATEASPTPQPTASPETVDVEIDVGISADAFTPSEITLPAGKKFRLKLTNGDAFIHNLRIVGPDGQWRTADDLVSGDVPGGGTGEVVGQINTPGIYNFRCDYHQTVHFGTIKVE